MTKNNSIFPQIRPVNWVSSDVFTSELRTRLDGGGKMFFRWVNSEILQCDACAWLFRSRSRWSSLKKLTRQGDSDATLPFESRHRHKTHVRVSGLWIQIPLSLALSRNKNELTLIKNNEGCLCSSHTALLRWDPKNKHTAHCYMHAHRQFYTVRLPPRKCLKITRILWETNFSPFKWSMAEEYLIVNHFTMSLTRPWIEAKKNTKLEILSTPSRQCNWWKAIKI